MDFSVTSRLASPVRANFEWAFVSHCDER